MFSAALYARVRNFLQICTRDRGCSAHPAFPAPSDYRRSRKLLADLGRNASRECGRMSSNIAVSETFHSRRPGLEPGPILRGTDCCRRYLSPVLSPIGRGVWVPAQGRDDKERRRHSRDPLARNDAEKANPDLIAPQLCGQYWGQNGRKTGCLAAFSGVPALYFRTRSGFTVILPSLPLIP